MNADRVKALILDCDGVLFDINEAKTLAFEETVKDYPDDKVALFVENHRKTGGVSRYEKFSWFFKELCPSSQPDQDIQKALLTYGDIVQRAYRQIKPVALAVRFVQKMSG